MACPPAWTWPSADRPPTGSVMGQVPVPFVEQVPGFDCAARVRDGLGGAAQTGPRYPRDRTCATSLSKAPMRSGMEQAVAARERVAQIPVVRKCAVRCRRAASSDAGTALDTGGSPDPAPPFGQRCGFALGLLADRKERTGSKESIELSRPSSNGHCSQLGGFVPGQRSPARDVGTRLFRCDERHERIITRGRSAKAKALIRGDASARQICRCVRDRRRLGLAAGACGPRLGARCRARTIR